MSFWSGDTTTGQFKIVLIDDSGGRARITFETEPIENLEYAKFGFSHVWEIPYITDDEGDRWLVIKPENWLEAFPVADRMLVTLPDSTHELEYTAAQAIGLKIMADDTADVDFSERVIVFGNNVTEARVIAKEWVHGILTISIKQVVTGLLFENPKDGNGFGEGLAIAAVTISRAMYPTDSDLEARKGPPAWLLPPKF